jgi:MFS family permease
MCTHVQYASRPKSPSHEARVENNRRLFYGWWIAIVAAIGCSLGGPPILVFSFPVFLKALIKEFHASQSAISLAFSLHNVVGAVGAPLFGRLVDRVGARRAIIPGTILLAVLLIGNRFITVSILGIYIINMLGALTGMSAGPIPYSSIISRWFDKRRGTALAVMMLGLGIGAVVMPSLVQRLITSFGWRAAYSIYGCAMLLISVPVVVAFLRDSPSEMGLLPDGVPASSLIGTVDKPVGLTWREARRTRTFWLMVSAFFLLGASVHACVLHLAVMLTDRGITEQTAASASSIAGAGVLLGRLASGFLLDRYPGSRVAICFSSGAAAGVLLLLLGQGAVAFAGALLVGLGMGAEGDLIAYLTSRYFGLKAFGELYGYAFGTFVLAGACGALLMGIGFDRTGSYTVPLLGFLTAIVVAIVLFSRLGPYRYGVREPSDLPAELKASAAAS